MSFWLAERELGETVRNLVWPRPKGNGKNGDTLKNFATRFALLLFPLYLLTTVQAQVKAGCPNGEPPAFGYFVNVSADAGVGKDHKKTTEKICWVVAQSKTGQDKLESQDQYADLTSQYSYTVAPTGISASVRLYGQVNNIKRGFGSGHANIWLMWHDTLTFHSKLIPLAPDPKDLINHPAQFPMMVAKSMIKVTVKLLQDQPQCAGGTGQYFKYKTGILVAARSSAGGDAIGPVKGPEGSTQEDWFAKVDQCGKVSDPVTLMVLNGKDLAIHITVDDITESYLDYNENPEGHLKAELSNVRVCVVRPAKPADLTVTSASGASYWCP
jgi:hypothetical protein